MSISSTPRRLFSNFIARPQYDGGLSLCALWRAELAACSVAFRGKMLRWSVSSPLSRGSERSRLLLGKFQLADRACADTAGKLRAARRRRARCKKARHLFPNPTRPSWAAFVCPVLPLVGWAAGFSPRPAVSHQRKSREMRSVRFRTLATNVRKRRLNLCLGERIA
jgi:hypothetical protein